MTSKRKSAFDKPMFTYQGIEIMMTNDGEFQGWVEEELIQKPTLAAMHQFIDRSMTEKVSARKLALKVCAKRRYKEEVVSGLTLTGIHRTSRNLLITGLSKGVDGGDLEYVMADMPKNRKRLETLIELGRQYEEMVEEIVKLTLNAGTAGYGRIELDSYEPLLKRLEQQYAKSAKDDQK